MAGYKTWIERQPRRTQIYVVIAGELNDCGIYLGGGEIKPNIRQEALDAGIEPTEKERQIILTGLLAENAISQNDLNKFARRHLRAKPAH